MHYENHIISNFPKDYPIWRKVWANLMFFFGRMEICLRKNLLNKDDIRRASGILKKGDVVLVGGLRRFSSLVIKGAVTHVMLYVGRKKFVHAVCDGVGMDSFDDIFREYDTMIVLRAKTKSAQRLDAVVAYAKAKIGVPFDYEFARDKAKYYCSELIYESFEAAGVSVGMVFGSEPIHPEQFLNGKFKVVFVSHNIRVEEHDGVRSVCVE